MVLCSSCAVNKNYDNFLKVQKVELRVAERWGALIGHEHAKAYEYLASSYKDMTSKDDYIKMVNPKVIWEKFDIMRTHCEKDICKVNVEVGYRIPPMFGMPRGAKTVEYVKETWLYQEGEWFYLPPMSK